MASISNKPMPDALEDRPTLEERRALIQRVAASEHFSRSARLRDFLLYVGKQSLKDGSPEIHEQELRFLGDPQLTTEARTILSE